MRASTGTALNSFQTQTLPVKFEDVRVYINGNARLSKVFGTNFTLKFKTVDGFVSQDIDFEDDEVPAKIDSLYIEKNE